MSSIIVRSARIAIPKGNIANLRVSVDRSLATAGGPAAGVVANAAVTQQGVSIILPQITLYTTWDAPDATTQQAQYTAELIDGSGNVLVRFDGLNPFQLRIANSQTTWKEIQEWNEFYRQSITLTPNNVPGQYDSEPVQIPGNNIFLGQQSNAATDSMGLYAGNADNPPGLRWNVATMLWEFSNDGTTWVSMASGGGGGSPAGPSGAIQFNDSGAFGGSAGFTYNNGSNSVSLGTAGLPGGFRLVGTSGNYWNLASQAPAGNRTFYFPDSVTPTTGNFLFVGTFGSTVQTDWSTGLTWSNTTRTLSVTGSVNSQLGALLSNTSGLAAAETVLGLTNDGSKSGFLSLTGGNFTPAGLQVANQLYVKGFTGVTQMLFELVDTGSIFRWGINGTERVRLDNTTGITITSPGGANTSGLKFVNLTSASPAGASTAYLGVDGSGNVVRAAAPGGGGGAPVDATYLVLSLNGTLTQERVFTLADTTLTESDGGAGGNYSISVNQANTFNWAAAHTHSVAIGAGSATSTNPSPFLTVSPTTAPGSGNYKASPSLILNGQANSGAGAFNARYRLYTLVNDNAGAATLDVQFNNANVDATFRSILQLTQGGATGLLVTGAAAGNGATLSPTSSGSNESLLLTPKGTALVSITNLADKGGQVFNVKSYGAKCDGVTDDSAAVMATIAAADAANGGVILFPPGTCRIDSQIFLPNDSATPPKQKSFTFRGSGASHNGQGGAPSGGTILNLRYNAGAKIETHGLGHFVIERMSLTCNAGDTAAFLKTTLTTIHVVDVEFYGAATGQIGIILGGTGTVADNSTNAPFQGYGTVIERNYFNRIGIGVQFNTYSNASAIVNNTWWSGCAGTSAIEINGLNPGNSTVGNLIQGNLIETSGYTYGIVLQNLAQYNTIAYNGFYDPTGTTTAYVRIADTTCIGNIIISGFSDGAKPFVSDASGGLNTIYDYGTGGHIKLLNQLDITAPVQITTTSPMAWIDSSGNKWDWFLSGTAAIKPTLRYTASGGSLETIWDVERTSSTVTTNTLTASSQAILQGSADLKVQAASGNRLVLGRSNNLVDFNNTGAGYRYTFGGAPAGTVLVGLTPSALAAGDIMLYGSFPSVTGSFDIASFTGNATGNTRFYLANSNAGANAHATLELQTINGAGDPRIALTTSGAQNWALGIDNSDADKFKISNSSGLGTNDYLVVDTNGNLGFNTSTFGAGATKTLTIASGTAPSSYPADAVQVMSADYAAGDARLRVYSENGANPVIIGGNAVLSGRQVVAKTVNYTVQYADSNTVFTNSGAAGSVTFTSSGTGVVESYTFEFIRVANQSVVIQLNPGEIIQIGASVTSAGGSVTLDAVGSRLRIVQVGPSLWMGDLTGAATFA